MTASGGATPAFCRKRRLSAIPPTFAGVTRFTNDDASWAARLGPNGRCSGTPPDSRPRRPRRCRSTSRRTPPATRSWRSRARRRCRRRRRAAEGARRTRPSSAAMVTSVRARTRTNCSRGAGASPVAEAMPSRRSRSSFLFACFGSRPRARAVAGRAPRRQLVRSDGPGPRGERRVHPDEGRERDEQLGAVDRLRPRVGRLGAEPEVDDHRVGAGHEDVRGPERPMRQPRRMEFPDVTPRASSRVSSIASGSSASRGVPSTYSTASAIEPSATR